MSKPAKTNPLLYMKRYNFESYLIGQGLSFDKARYISIDEQRSYRWHTKGNKGILSYLEADLSAKEKNILSNCFLSNNQVS